MKQDLPHASIEPLLNYFDKLIPLNKEEKELVVARFHSRLFRKRQFVLQEGDICNQFNFVVRGCLRTYKIDEKGNTHILQFASEKSKRPYGRGQHPENLHSQQGRQRVDE